MLKDGKLSRISPYNLHRLFQIVSIEGSITALQNQKAKIPDNSLKKHYYDLDIFSYSQEITDLTGNLDPHELMQEMKIFD